MSPGESARSRRGPDGILVVGAGAIGRVYAHHLAAGGAQVSVMVRDRHAAELRAGLTLRRVHRGGRHVDARFVPHEVLVGIESLAGRRFDQVWLGLATDALDGPWVDALIDAIGDATLVSLQPGAHVASRLARAHLVRGAIGIVAWASPLEGSADRSIGSPPPEPTVRAPRSRPVPPRASTPAVDPRQTRATPATAYWFPPLSPTSFSSDDRARASAVVRALRAGGCPTALVPDADATLAVGASIIQPVVAALELSGWSMRALRRSPNLARALAAARAMLVVSSRQLRRRTPWIGALLRAPLIAPVIAIAPWLVPFDLERYLEVHFRKVGAQTRALLAQSVDDARALNVDGAPIAALCAELERATSRALRA